MCNEPCLPPAPSHITIHNSSSSSSTSLAEAQVAQIPAPSLPTLRSRGTSGLAFSLMVSDAEVCWTAQEQTHKEGRHL